MHYGHEDQGSLLVRSTEYGVLLWMKWLSVTIPGAFFQNIFELV